MQVGLGTDVAARLVVVSYGWGGALQVDVLGASLFGVPGQSFIQSFRNKTEKMQCEKLLQTKKFNLHS